MNLHKNQKMLYNLVYAGMIGAIYVVLTMMFAPIAYGPIQFRISEALCILPFFTPAAVPGVFIGCLLSNILTGAVPLDIIFGSLATLIGALGSLMVRRHKFAVCIPPIISNILIIPWILKLGYGAPDLVPFMMLTVGIGEILAIGVLGNILLLALERYKNLIFRADAA